MKDSYNSLKSKKKKKKKEKKRKKEIPSNPTKNGQKTWINIYFFSEEDMQMVYKYIKSAQHH